jgi:hypothetical protein
MYQAGDLIGQDLTISALKGVEHRPHDFLGRTLRRVDIARKVGVDEACVQPDDLGALLRDSFVKRALDCWTADLDRNVGGLAAKTNAETASTAILHRSNSQRPMSALGQKRTLRRARAMSALLPKADIAKRDRDVR